MFVRSITDAEHKPVTVPGAEKAEMSLMVGREHGAPNFALRHFRVEPGGHSPRHSHDYEHQVYIVSGRGTVLLGGFERPVKSGDVVYVPADEEHQFRALETDPLHFLCIVPVTRNCGEPTPGS